MTETLNLEAMRRETLLKAVKKYETIAGVAKALGVSNRTAIRWKRNYGLSKIRNKNGMKDSPILMSTPMAMQTYRKNKTETRRTTGLKEINEAPDDWELVRVVDGYAKFWQRNNATIERHIKSPYGTPGDLLWVRESWAARDIETSTGKVKIEYKATPDAFRRIIPVNSIQLTKESKWKPSIHIPKDVARTWLRMTELRVERLNDIKEESALKEGIAQYTKDGGRVWKYGIPDLDGLPGNCDIGWEWKEWKLSAKSAYMELWDQINGVHSRLRNPWLWVIEYEVISTDGEPSLLNTENK